MVHLTVSYQWSRGRSGWQRDSNGNGNAAATVVVVVVVAAAAAAAAAAAVVEVSVQDLCDGLKVILLGVVPRVDLTMRG